MIGWRKVLLVSMVILLLIISVGNLSSVNYPILEKGISPVSTVMKLPMRLYFIDALSGHLVPENRDVTVRNNRMVDGIVTALQEGPKNKQLLRPLDETVHVESSEIEGRVCFLNFNKEFLNTRQWQTLNHSLVLNSIVDSLTEQEQIQSVQFLIDGKPIREVVVDLKDGGPMKRDEKQVYTVKSPPIEVVLLFLNSIQTERYDIAYDLIDFKSRSVLSYDQFVRQMSNKATDYLGYERKVVFTQRLNQRIMVYIRYESQRMNLSGQRDSFSENWEVVLEDQTYKVLLNGTEK